MADENEGTEGTKRNTEAQKENNDARKSAIDLLEELVKKEKQYNEEATRRDIIEMEYLERIGKTNAAREAAMKLIDKVNRQQSALTTTQHQLADAEERLAAGNFKNAEERQKLVEEIEKYNKSIEQSTKLIEDHKEELEAAEGVLKRVGEISKEDQESVKSLTSAFEGMTMGLISANAAQEHMITKSGLMIVELMKADNAAQVLTESFFAVFNPANIMAELFDTIKAATFAMAESFDQAAAQFSKTTGLAREYGDVLYGVQRAGNQFGVSAKEGGDAMASLLADFSDFHKTAPAVQEDLALNVAQLNKFGVSTSESAKLMQNFNKIMGMSGKEAVETSKKIGMMGTQIGISTSKMLKDYTASLKTLAVYGDKSIDVFTGIAAAAKSAGVETGTLLAMVEKFDTFAGAAEGAGKLNAILGSQLSATEMLMMTEDERLKTMISTMQATGQSFGSMDKFTQKAIAQAAGISDMAEANKIFGMSLGEYESYEMQMKQANKTQERFDAALQSMIPLREKLSLLANEFAAVFVPALEVATVVVEKFIGFMRWLDEWTNGYATTIMGGVAAVFLLVKAMNLLSGGILKNIALKAKDTIATLINKSATDAETISDKVNTEVKDQKNKVTEKGANIQDKANKATSSGVGPMLALAAAVALIGGGIYLAATGLAEFVKAFSLLSGEQLQYASLGLVVFTLAFVGLIAVLAALVTGPQAIIAAGALSFLLGVGAAALMIGGGIYLAATGMAAFIESLSGLNDAADAMDSLTGAKDVAVNVATRLLPISKFLGDVKAMDIKNELENIALITTGTSANLMTENAVSNLVTVASLADQIKNIFNAEVVINIDGDAVKDLFEDGVYKTSMGNT
jgi:hypothetical protein